MNTAFQNIQVAILLITISAVIAALVTPIILLAVQKLLQIQATHRARQHLTQVDRKLQAEIMFAPEPWESTTEQVRYERECQNLREEMASIIERHGIHPYDSIKPF